MYSTQMKKIQASLAEVGATLQERELLVGVELRGSSGGAIAKRYPSGEGRLYADDVIVNIAGAGGTMMVSA